MTLPATARGRHVVLVSLLLLVCTGAVRTGGVGFAERSEVPARIAFAGLTSGSPVTAADRPILTRGNARADGHRATPFDAAGVEGVVASHLVAWDVALPRSVGGVRSGRPRPGVAGSSFGHRPLTTPEAVPTIRRAPASVRRRSRRIR